MYRSRLKKNNLTTENTEGAENRVQIRLFFVFFASLW